MYQKQEIGEGGVILQENKMAEELHEPFFVASVFTAQEDWWDPTLDSQSSWKHWKNSVKGDEMGQTVHFLIPFVKGKKRIHKLFSPNSESDHRITYNIIPCIQNA